MEVRGILGLVCELCARHEPAQSASNPLRRNLRSLFYIISNNRERIRLGVQCDSSTIIVYCVQNTDKRNKSLICAGGLSGFADRGYCVRRTKRRHKKNTFNYVSSK